MNTGRLSAFSISAVALLAASFFLAPTSAMAQSDRKMTNADVISLVNAGLGEEIVVAKIRAASATDFDTGIDGLKNLQAAKVPVSVLRVMIDPHGQSYAPRVAAVSTSNNPEEVHAPGIYLYSSVHGITLAMLPRANAKSSKHEGTFVSAHTLGIVSAKTRAVIDGGHATIQTPDEKPCFYLYNPPNTALFGGSGLTPGTFSLVKFEQKGNSRQIVEGSYSMWGGKSGIADKAKQGFTSEEIKPGIYRLTLDQSLAPGEYGFAETRGMFFDFAVVASDASR